MVATVYVPLLAEKLLYPLDWIWPGSIVFHYGEPVSMLPGVALTVLLAPRVGYRRRDALMLLFPPGGIRVAWIIGTRVGQLPYRDWPARTDAIPVQGRQAARIAAAAIRYRNWRDRRVSQRPPAVTPGPSLTDEGL